MKTTVTAADAKAHAVCHRTARTLTERDFPQITPHWAPEENGSGLGFTYSGSGRLVRAGMPDIKMVGVAQDEGFCGGFSRFSVSVLEWTRSGRVLPTRLIELSVDHRLGICQRHRQRRPFGGLAVRSRRRAKAQQQAQHHNHDIRIGGQTTS